MPIRKVPTPRGRVMPLDANPTAKGNVYVDDQGLARVVRKGEDPAAHPVLYLPHFASCPFADRFKRRRRPVR